LIAIASGYVFYVIVNCAFLHLLSTARTLGMAIMGIKTCHADKSRIRFKEAFLKALTTGLTAMDLVNSIYMLSSHTERSVFDRLTNTLVVDTRAK
jgi:uncharacterized RDD family membrane protein YckC